MPLHAQTAMEVVLLHSATGHCVLNQAWHHRHLHVWGVGPVCQEERTRVQLLPQPAGHDVREPLLLHDMKDTALLCTHMQPQTVEHMPAWSGAQLVRAGRFGWKCSGRHTPPRQFPSSRSRPTIHCAVAQHQARMCPASGTTKVPGPFARLVAGADMYWKSS